MNDRWAVSKGCLAALILLAALGCSTGKSPRVQDPVSNAVDSGTFVAKRAERMISPDELAEQFDSEVELVYRLGAGDQISIEVWDHPELSGLHVLGPDGVVTLPVAGDLELGGLGRDQARSSVSSAYANFYLDLEVTLRVEEYNSYAIQILGRVANPGLVRFTSPPSLLDAITQAGGLPVGGLGADKAALTRCAVFRGRDRVLWIDLNQLLSGQNLALNIRLKPQDTVYLPDADDQLVYVMGELEETGAYNLKPNMSLLDAINLAGGPTRDASDRVLLVRGDLNTSTEFSIRELISQPATLNYVLQEGDVIFVPQRGLAKLGYVLEKLSPFTGFLLLGNAIAN